MTLTLVTLSNGGIEPTITTTLTSQRFSTTGPASSMTDLLPVTTYYEKRDVNWPPNAPPPPTGATSAGCDTAASSSGSNAANENTLTVRMFIGGTTRASTNDAAATWADRLIIATRFYEENRFLEVKSVSHFDSNSPSKGLSQHITVTYILKNPYWHDTANDGSRRLFP